MAAQTYDTEMPSNYQTPPPSDKPFDLTFFTRPEGWVKITEAVLCLIVFICATVYEPFVKHWGGGWVQFVSMTTLLFALILITFYVFLIFEKLPHNIPFLLIELIYAGVVTGLFFTCGITAAVKGNKNSAIGAATFFSFAAMAAFAVDTFLLFMRWRGQHGGSDPAGVTPAPAPSTVTTPGTGIGGTYDIQPGVYPGALTADRPEAGKPPY